MLGWGRHFGGFGVLGSEVSGFRRLGVWVFGF